MILVMRDLYLFAEICSKKCVFFASLFSYTRDCIVSAGLHTQMAAGSLFCFRKGSGYMSCALRSPAGTPVAG